MKSEKVKKTVYVVIVLAVVYLQHFQLSYSATVPLSKILFLNPFYQIINLMVAAVFFLLIWALVRKSAIAALISALNLAYENDLIRVVHERMGVAV